MAKLKDECINTARQSLNLFTGEELEEYIKRVSSRARELEHQGVPFSRDIAIKEINKDNLADMLTESANAALDVSKYGTIKTKMDAGVSPRALLEKTAKNTDYNVETANNAAKQILYDRAFGTLEKEHLDLLTTGELEDEILAYADGKKIDNPLVQRIGKSLTQYPDSRNTMLIKSTAMHPSELNGDRFFKATYDPSKLTKIGRESWIELHKSRIDVEGTFRNTRAMNLDGSINETIVNEMIANTFDNIVQGNGSLFTKASVSRDREMVQRTRRMFYKYKDWSSWGMANKEYGQGSLFKSWLADVNTSSQQIGMAEIMGSNPHMMWNEIRHIQVKKEPATALNSIKYQQNDALFNQLIGVNKSIYNPTIASIGSATRSISSMARLASIVLRSIPDLANVAGIAQRAGVGFWQPFFDSIVNAFNLIPSASRKNLARTMAASLNTHMGAVSRYSEMNGMGNMADRLSNKFFHTIGLESWDTGNKLSAMQPVMKGYGRDSSKSFARLNGQQQSWLNRFNISEVEWDALRSKTEKGLFSTDNVTNMTDSEIKELWNKTDKMVPLSEYGSTLYRKVFGMFDTLHEFAVLNPTAYTKMITTGNTRAGTIHGEIMRMIMQFKGYPIQYMKRVWIGGMQEFDSYQAKFMYALNMGLGTVMLASLADVLISISKGYTPPNPAKMSRYEQLSYYSKMLAGGLGIFGTIMNERATAKSVSSAMIATPSIRLASDPFIGALALATGNLKGAKNAVKDWANVANPIATVPVASKYIDAFMGNKPYLEPGQTPLY